MALSDGSKETAFIINLPALEEVEYVEMPSIIGEDNTDASFYRRPNNFLDIEQIC